MASLLMAGGLLVGCSGPVTDDEAAQFVDLARDEVPSAQSYGDDALTNMATNVCQVLESDGTTIGDADNVLDNYSQLTPEDRQKIAGLAVGSACPEHEGKIPG